MTNENEKNYLSAISQLLNEYATRINQLKKRDDYCQLALELVKEVKQKDHELRIKYNIAQFKVINSQLTALIANIEQQCAQMPSTIKTTNTPRNLSSDDVLVYIYLFNARGMNFKSWEALMTPKALLDAGVNRPVYATKEQIEAYLRSKPTDNSHAYLEVVIKKPYILPSHHKDALGQPLIKLKEGAVLLENVKNFYCNHNFYRITKDGKLEKL